MEKRTLHRDETPTHHRHSVIPQTCISNLAGTCRGVLHKARGVPWPCLPREGSPNRRTSVAYSRIRRRITDYGYAYWTRREKEEKKEGARQGHRQHWQGKEACQFARGRVLCVSKPCSRTWQPVLPPLNRPRHERIATAGDPFHPVVHDSSM